MKVRAGSTLLIVAGLLSVAAVAPAACPDLPAADAARRKVVLVSFQEEVEALSAKPGGESPAISRVMELFDWDEMARRALGRHWQDRDGTEQADFRGVFRDFFARSYVRMVDRDRNREKLNVSHHLDCERALLDSTVRVRGRAVLIRYRLLWRTSAWRIYDIERDGVSQLKSYYLLFDRMLLAGSYRELVRGLRAEMAQR